MKKFLYALPVLTFGVTACEKKPATLAPDPQPTSAFTRTFVYPNRGTANTATYDTAYKMEARAGIEDNHIFLGFVAAPRLPETSGDGIVFHLDKAHLQALAKTYNLDGKTIPTVLSVWHTYTFLRADESLWGSIQDSKTGLQFEGYLAIEKWDAARQLMSGSYRIEIKNLINDPMKNSVAQPIDPMNKCNVIITGTFSNVKLETN